MIEVFLKLLCSVSLCTVKHETFRKSFNVLIKRKNKLINRIDYLDER